MVRTFSDTAWWRRGNAAEVQLRRPSVQLGGQASILNLCANARDAVPRCLSAGWCANARHAGARRVVYVRVRNRRAIETLPYVEAFCLKAGENGQ